MTQTELKKREAALQDAGYHKTQISSTNDYMKSTMADFEIAAVVESNIATVVELKKSAEA